MATSTAPRRAAALLWPAMLGLAVVACSAGRTNPSAAPSEASPSPTSPPAASPSATAGPIVLDDAGVEVALPSGTYTSRVFTPTIQLDLDGAWLRRDDIEPNKIKLSDGASDRTLSIVRVDYVQCGTEALLDHPKAAAAAAALAGASKLAPSAPRDVALGDRKGIAVDLAGTGPGVGDAIDPANGCIFSAGEAAWPAESFWLVFAPDSRAHEVFVDVGSALVVVSARSGAATPAELATMADPVIATVRFPDDPAQP